jgi:hypothetical protein
MLNIAQKEALRKIHPYLFEAIVALENAVNNISAQSGYDSAGVFPTTTNIAACNVTAANGLLSIQIIDNSLVNAPANTRTITYFVEIASDAGFVNVLHHESKVAARNFYIPVNNQTVFVRAYSQLQGSAPSQPIAFGGTTPTAIAGGGALAPPAAQAYQGSGNVSISGKGFGAPVRSPQRNLL